jgi:hypothetical protein
MLSVRRSAKKVYVKCVCSPRVTLGIACFVDESSLEGCELAKPENYHHKLRDNVKSTVQLVQASSTTIKAS